MKKLPKFISYEEALKLFKRAKTARDRVLFETLYYCGLRVSEATSLLRKNVDIKEGFIKVVGKGQKERIVPIPKPLILSLESWFALNHFEADNRIFKISRIRVHQIIKQLNSNIHAHTLRHSFGTYLKEKGADLKDIQEIMGHSNLETTKVYLHLSKEYKRKLVDKVFENG